MIRPLDALSAALPHRGSPPLPPEARAAAAVAAILLPDGDDARLLFIERAARADDPWSGHMAFPGGRVDAGDVDLVATARRETLEEVGLDLDAHAKLVGALDPLAARSRGQATGMWVAPIVWVLAEEPELSPNHEVAATVWGSLDAIARGRHATTIDWSYRGSSLRLPAFAVGDRVVWGLTHEIVSRLVAPVRAALAGA